MEEGFKFKKARMIEFGRLGDNEFIAQFVDEDGNVVYTLEPREIFVNESYVLDFGWSFPILSENLEDLIKE